MSIRRRILLVFSALLAATSLLGGYVVHRILAASFGQLERQYAQLRADQIDRALEEELATVDKLAHDYAAWDDTYAYAAKPSAPFIRSSLPDDALIRLEVQVVAIVDARGTLLFGRSVGRSLAGALSPAWQHFIAATKFPEHLTTPDAVDRSVVRLGDGVWLMAVRPIVTSESHGPAHGALLMARRLDDALVARVGQTSGLEVRAEPAGDGSAEGVRVLDDDTIAASTMVRDRDGKAVARLTTTMAREIEERRRSAFRLVILAVAVAGAILAAGTLLFGQRFVLRRVARLESFLRDVDRTGDLRARLPDDGPDEIGGVARVLNSLLAALETRSAELHEAQATAIEASKRKSEFLAHMSHEIRTPMNGVLGVASLLADTPLTAQQREWLDVIRNSGDVLLAIINDILDLSKIEAGKLDLEHAVFNPRQMASDIEHLFGPLAHSKNLRLSVEIDPSVPARVVSDPTRMKQVVTNLLSNALKFTSVGGVTLRISTSPHPGNSDALTLRLSVSDTGPGIAPDRLAQLFTPFTQGDSSVARRFGGTGLGLAISRRLTELMDGDLTATSDVGVGSTFVATFMVIPMLEPVKAPALVTAPPADHTAAVAPGDLRILLVEDNPTNQMVALKMLERAGYRADLAEDGLQAVDAVERRDYDLVLMDIQMPNMDGLEATRRIRARHAGRPRIIAMTAHVFEEDRLAAVDAGMTGLIAKPLRASELTAALVEVVH